ncbi:MAG: NAD-dependent epimerase/dehydratase family protein [Chloroflexi bacterium]|nr:NAD-dependent epimerase/dehydratase family protein [Chloroflexota bacterium]
MNVLVTGGLGVNGAWVVRELVAKGVRPVVIENRLDTSLIADIVNQVELAVADITDIACLIRNLKRYDVTHVLHLAALMPDQAQADPLLGFRVNAMGTVNVLEAARIVGVERVVFTSSKGVYGRVRGEHGYPTYRPLNEDYPTNPTNVYDVAKLASEGMGFNYHQNYGLDFIALRFSTIYGPGKLARHGNIAQHSKIIENSMLGKPTNIAQGADERDDMVYVKDVAQGIVRACFARDLQHRVFNIGTGMGTTLVDFANAVRLFYPDASIQLGPGLNYMGGTRGCFVIFDISRARQELGYEPVYDIQDGVEDYVETMKRLNIAPQYTA